MHKLQSPPRQRNYERARWCEIDVVVEAILEYCDPQTAFFAGRAVSTTWQHALHTLGNHSWRHITTSCARRTLVVTKLLSKVCPEYEQVRKFCIDSLRESRTLIPHLMLLVNGSPILWLTDVPQGVTFSELLELGLPHRGDRLELSDVAVACGCRLNASVPISDHVWAVKPVGGKSGGGGSGSGGGWGYDMAVMCNALDPKTWTMKRPTQPTPFERLTQQEEAS